MSYKVSKDYPRLKQLMDEGHKVACWVTYDIGLGYFENKRMVTDIMQAQRRGTGEDLTYAVSVRGCTFMEFHPAWAWERYSDKDMFRKFEIFNLQFIDPDTERNILDLEMVCWHKQ